jgi:hypothetical protein
VFTVNNIVSEMGKVLPALPLSFFMALIVAPLTPTTAPVRLGGSMRILFTAGVEAAVQVAFGKANFGKPGDHFSVEDMRAGSRRSAHVLHANKPLSDDGLTVLTIETKALSSFYTVGESRQTPQAPSPPLA